MTPTQLKTRMTTLGLSQGRLADALGVSRETVVRWSTGKLPMPQWLPYALGMTALGAAPIAKPEKPVDAPKPVAAPIAPKSAVAPLVIPAKPKDDGRPFKYIGGRKVYLD